MGFNSAFKGLEGPKCEAGDTPPSGVEVTKERSCIFIPPLAFMACKKKKNFIYDTEKTVLVTSKLFSNV